MIPQLEGTRETIKYDLVKGIRLYRNREVEDYPLHWHTALEIIAPIESGYTAIIDNQVIDFFPGDILFIPPGTLHQLKAPATGSRIILLADYSLIGNIPGVDSLFAAVNSSTLIRKADNPELADYLSKQINHLFEEYVNHDSFCAALIYSDLIRFLVAIGRAHLDTESKFPEATNAKRHEYIQRFMTICEYMTQHCAEDLSMDDLANLAGFSRFHFSRLFKQFTGLSCYEYLTKCRIDLAERLLINPDLSVTDVAMQAGFNSLSTFNRIFKTAKNCNPTEYKKMNKNHHM